MMTSWKPPLRLMTLLSRDSEPGRRTTRPGTHRVVSRNFSRREYGREWTPEFSVGALHPLASREGYTYRHYEAGCTDCRLDRRRLAPNDCRRPLAWETTRSR